MNTAMTWEQICDDPNLRDLPFKIEQDRYGRIVMSPVMPKHGGYQGEVYRLLHDLMPDWTVIVECAVDTPEGVKVPDVAAMPRDRVPDWTEVPNLSVAPDLCVEVLSPSNTAEEMDEKRRLYAAKGCREFWTCSEEGQMTFLDAATGQDLPLSVLCPAFPALIRLE
jgi:Uma2 family endonuclease